MLKHSPAFHFRVDSSIPSRSQGEVALAFNDDLTIIEESWKAALREEYYRFLVISEIVILLEVANNLVMIHLTSHKIPFDEAACVVDSCAVLDQITQSL